MKEPEIAEYYERRKGDLSLWEDKPAKVKVRRGTSVFCIRLTKEELELLQQRSQEQGMTLSAFIRRSALKESQAAVVQPIVNLTPVGLGLNYFAVTLESVTAGAAGEAVTGGGRLN